MKGFKTYLTFLNRNKLFTVVNVAGLSISLMFVLLIANMVTRQLTVDKDIKDADRTYVFATDIWAGGHYNLGPLLKGSFPEIEDWTATSGIHSSIVTVNDNPPMSIYIEIARKNFFQFFSYKILQGNAEGALVSNNTITLTRSCAIKLFGTDQGALGKTVKLKAAKDQPFTVGAVIEDIDNSLIPDRVEAFIPFENMTYFNWSSSIESTGMNNAAGSCLFFRFPKNVDPNAKANDVVKLLKQHYWIYERGGSSTMQFIPMRKLYFSELPTSTDINQYSLRLLIIFLTTGVLILLMAVFNYTSMSVAQTSYRAKEMATRRLLGSSRPDIFWHMIGESLGLTLVAFLIGFLLAKAAEPYAIDLLQVKLNIVGDLSVTTILIYVLFILLLSFIAGFAPATILSNYNPLDVVKGTFRRKTKAIYLRGLSVIQSGLTIAMLTCACYLSVQIYRILHAPLGYTYGNILDYPPRAKKATLQLFRNEAAKKPYVKRVSFAQGTPVDGGNNNTMYIPMADSTLEMSFQSFIVDSAFMKMFSIAVTEDRKTPMSFSNYLISEQAMKQLGNPRDYFTPEGWDGPVRIAGQFKDFKIRSLVSGDIQHPLRICVMPTDSIYPWNILVETRDGDLAHYKQDLDALYSKLIDGQPFNSQWYGQEVKDTYDDISRINKLIYIFTGAALIISLLGLTAMSIYFITQRKRDMAVRKVFGSTVSNELRILMGFSFKSLLISLLIAIPLMWLGIHHIYKLVPFEGTFPWWIPIASFLTVTIISLGSVYLISLKATRENPVNNLKTE